MHLMDLLGNKIDFDINKKVNYEDGYSFGEEKRITFFEISSKRGRGIVDVFQNFFENVGNYFKKLYKIFLKNQKIILLKIQ